MAPGFAHILLLSIVALSILLMLLRPRGIAEVWWVGSGAVLLVLLRLVPVRLAGRALAEGTDVYLFLIGMMLLSELAREHGVFDWVAAAAVRHAKGKSLRLFALLYGVGTLVTVCLSNDATAVVLTPAVLSAVKKARVNPLPYLFACAMIANAASFVLPISNPANLVVFHTGMPPLGRWLAAFLVPSVLSIAATFLVLRWYFMEDLRAEVEGEQDEVVLARSGKLVLAGVGLVVVVLLVASAFRLDLGLPTCVAAVVIAGVVSGWSRRNPVPLVKAVSWSTLLLVAGLFVMVDAVESLGALRYMQAALGWAEHVSAASGVLVVGFVIGVANNVVNNLPLGLIVGATVQEAHVQGLLAHAVLIGVDLGPNLSVTGSLATVLWLLAMRRDGLRVSARDFLKVGLAAMPVAMLAALGGLLALHLLVGR